MPSPYSLPAEDFVRVLNTQFLAVFGLIDQYMRDDLLPDQRCGIISFRSLEPDSRHRQASRNVRTGFEFQVFKVDILLTFGKRGRIAAEGAAIAGMIDLQHGVPFMKRTLPGDFIHDLQISSPVRTLMRQSIKPPHTWLVDVTCEATAAIAIYKNAAGEHEFKENLENP